MSKAEKFISDCTKNCSNIIETINRDKNVAVVYQPWLTPENALRAVEIARKETIEKVVKWLEDNAIDYWGTEAVDNGMMVVDLRKAMEE